MAKIFTVTAFVGDSARARVMRGTLMMFVQFAGGKVLRLISNLILTRILFPEAFGMMALITVFIGALEMFSDMGVNASIIKSKRGHEPIYLNTAWTAQILRGVLLYVMALILCRPVAQFYEEPMLAELLPVAALSMLITGFSSTKEAAANKKILMGRITAIGLSCQLLGIIFNVIMALWLQSVWGLIFGGLIASMLKVVLTHKILPGEPNRLAWDWDIFWDIFHFGKYLFVSSIAGFLINQGDRAILGKFVSLAELAVYNIGWLLASLPMAFNRLFGRRILFPLYAEKPPGESAENRSNVVRVRFVMTGSMLLISLGLGLAGVWIVEALYLPAYYLAGPVLVLVALGGMPQVISSAYGGLLLGVGDSRNFTVLLIATAAIQTTLLLFGVQAYGMLAAIFAPGLSAILVYPLTVYLLRRHAGWNPLHDLIYAGVALMIAGLVLSVHSDAIARILAGSG